MTIDRLVSPVTEGDPLRFELTADPAPTAPITVSLRWDDPGRRLSGSPPRRVTIPTSGTVTFTEATRVDDVDDRVRKVRVTVVAGSGYVVEDPSTAGITVEEHDFPRVTVVADATPVNEGDVISFTLTASPPPTSPLTVNLNWVRLGLGPRLISPLPKTVTIPTSGWYTLPLATVDDLIENYEPGGAVGFNILAGKRYFVGSPADATVWVVDDD